MPDEPTPQQVTAPATPAAPTPKPVEPSTPSGDKGYPKDTPLTEMRVEERESYWKDIARKHEATVKARGDYDDLKAKAAKHDALERELMSDKDKAVAEARDAARTEALQQVTPKLVAAEFKAAAAGRIDAERLATIVEPLDLSKFMKDGEVNTDMVSAYVDGIAPRVAVPRGPSSQGQGQRGSTVGPSLASGRDLYLAKKKQ